MQILAVFFLLLTTMPVRAQPMQYVGPDDWSMQAQIAVSALFMRCPKLEPAMKDFARGTMLMVPGVPEADNSPGSRNVLGVTLFFKPKTTVVPSALIPRDRSIFFGMSSGRDAGFIANGASQRWLCNLPNDAPALQRMPEMGVILAR